MNRLLIITVKNPELGKVKTRLAKELGEERALAIYYKLLSRTREVIEDLPLDIAIAYSGFIDTEDNWDNKRYTKIKQCEGDIGVRMNHAIVEGFELGYEEVCLIGSDIYEINKEVIMDAFEQLQSHDVVIGPAKDGGYYLIGMKKPYPEIFNLDAWSVSNVFDETICRIEKLGLRWARVKTLSDVDYASDLKGTDLI